MDTTTLLFFVLGLVLLIAGAEWLVRGASRLAATFGVSPLVIGLTVVAFGTSSPELAVSVNSALTGNPDIAVGNVVGSNIFNVLFILGLAALITPLVVAQQLIRLDVPLLIVVSILMYLLALDGRVGRLDGLLLFAGVVAYTVFSIVKSRRESAEVRAEYNQEFGAAQPQNKGGILLDLALIAIGLALLVLGSRWLVDGAIAIARFFGLSELIIGLTIVAAGTSLPEVAATVIASLKGERDIAVGNAIGSNLFNIMAVLGLTALLAPAGVAVSSSALNLDIPVMIAVAVACLPIFFTGHLIERWEGAVFLGYYLAYTAYLVLSATQHGLLPAFSGVMLGFVMPLTFITLAILAWRASRASSGHTPS